MAGIGLVLRQLYRQDNLSGPVRACLHSAFASTGPWLFTVLALGMIAALGHEMLDNRALFAFRVVLIYNFAFSFVISGPVFMIVTRYLSDCIYRHDLSNASGLLLGSLILLWAVGLAIVYPFYAFYIAMPPLMVAVTVIDYLLLCMVWLASIFISAMRNYRMVTRAFFIGMFIAVLASLALAAPLGVAGMLIGFSAGLSVIIGLLLGGILIEYPNKLRRPFAFLSYFRKYWELALGGLIYNMAIWADKWVMWFAPEATVMHNGLVVFPHYDSTMFIAYMTTVPAMAMFLFSAETRFFDHYVRFYRDIEGKASFSRIQKNYQEIAESIFGSAGRFVLLQGSITMLCLLMAPEIIGFLRGNYVQIGMLRYGLLGSMFQILTLFMLVLLAYFDSRKAALAIQAIFLVTNVGFTWLTMQAGFAYYGFGYFLSTFVTFMIAAVILVRYVAWLPYHTFVTTNVSVE